MNRTRYIPSIVMLAADFVACIATIYFKYTTREIMLIVLATSVIFLVLGLFIKMFAEKYLVVETMKDVLEEDGENTQEEDTDKDNKDNKDNNDSKKDNKKEKKENSKSTKED